MKSSTVGLAVLAALTPAAALAQSTVTVFGIVDVALAYVKGDGDGAATNGGQDGSSTRVLSGRSATGRFGIRGVEDLGGGLQAAFWLESQVQPDDGTGTPSNTNNQASGAATGNALQFNRRATVSVLGGFGEVRLGRDNVPSFWNLTTFDPFGTVGIAGSQNFTFQPNLPTTIRASNTVGYLLPQNLGGIYGQAMVAFGENVSNTPTEKDGNYTGIRLGWSGGAFNVAAASGKTKYATTATLGDYTQTNVGVQYQIGAFKFTGLVNDYTIVTTPGDIKLRTMMVGGWITLGVHEIKWSFNKLDDRSASALLVNGAPRNQADADLIGVGYLYHFSRRTALYGTVSQLSNDANARYAVSNGVSPDFGKKSKGVEAGIRHVF